MANPALVKRQLMGVPDEVSAERVAQVLHALGIERAFVVHGDLIDELPLDDSGVVYDVSAAGVHPAPHGHRRGRRPAARRHDGAGRR